VPISDAQFTGVITLSMLTPSWDPVVGTLGGVLDPKVVTLYLITKWSQRQGLTSTGKDQNIVFQTGSSRSKFENCGKSGHIKAKCWQKEVVRKDNIQRDTTHKLSIPSQIHHSVDLWIQNCPDIWFTDQPPQYMSAKIRKTLSLTEDTTINVHQCIWQQFG